MATPSNWCFLPSPGRQIGEVPAIGFDQKRSKNFMGFPEQDWMILVIASWGCFRILNMGLCIQIIVDLIPPIFC